MSESRPDSSSTSTILHLEKFAPSAPAPSSPPAESGVTVMVKRAAHETVENSGAPVLPRNPGALPPREMLGAVSYCYAKGVYQSEEIEKKMLHNPELRESLHGEVPDAQAIRRFRSLNRGAIQRTLEKAFGFIKHKKDREPLQPLPGQPAPPVPAEAALGESTIIMARHQAEERMEQASFVDNMSKES